MSKLPRTEWTRKQVSAIPSNDNAVSARFATVGASMALLADGRARKIARRSRWNGAAYTLAKG